MNLFELSVRRQGIKVERLFLLQSSLPSHVARTVPRLERGKLNKITRDEIKFTVNVSREEAGSPNHVACEDKCEIVEKHRG